MGCAFAGSPEAIKAGIKITERDDGKPQADTAKTRQVKKLNIVNYDYKMVDTDKYEFVGKRKIYKKKKIYHTTVYLLVKDSLSRLNGII